MTPVQQLPRQNTNGKREKLTDFPTNLQENSWRKFPNNPSVLVTTISETLVTVFAKTTLAQNSH